MCWNITGSPPPAALKKEVPKYLSVNSIVTAPANTGKDAIRRNPVIIQVQTNKGNFNKVIPGALILKTVASTLIAPPIDEAPKK